MTIIQVVLEGIPFGPSILGILTALRGVFSPLQVSPSGFILKPTLLAFMPSVQTLFLA